MNILLCAGTTVNQDNGFNLSYATAPRKYPSGGPPVISVNYFIMAQECHMATEINILLR